MDMISVCTFSGDFLSFRGERDARILETEEGPRFRFEVDTVEASERYVATVQLHGATDDRSSLRQWSG